MLPYGLISKVIPESKVKTKIRNFFYGRLVYGFTLGTAQCPLKDNVTARFRKLVFLPNETHSTEIKGYEKYYAIKPGDVVIDGGAYLGHFAIYAAMKVGRLGKVICFEPDPYIFRLLRMNISLNDVKNIVAINKGIWSHDARLRFDSRGERSTFVEQNGDGRFLRTVAAVSLDQEMQRLNIERVDLIKMDIEGAEIQAVQGCLGLIRQRDVHFAVASYHVVDGAQTASFLEACFAAQGYWAVTDYPAHQTTYAGRRNAPPPCLSHFGSS